MEVRGVSQGGQKSFDTNNDSVVAAVSTSIESKATKVNTSSEGKEVELSDKELKAAVDKLNSFLLGDNIQVEYEVHPKFKDVMMKIVDKKTGEVITEVPPKKILDMVARMCELVGVLFDKTA